ncbi:MAG: peptide ABC transporter substrate-binding protein [Sphaerochaeta sp.]|nr:peptide ABC transporter substrate-binding protein [Sphaerochaeta sp.]
MRGKRSRVFLLVLALSLFALSASGTNEMGYVQIGAHSDDPLVSMKTLTYADLYVKVLWERLELAYEGIVDTVLLQFSDEINAFYAMEPELWETDEMFGERADQEGQLLSDALYDEVERIALEKLLAAEEQEMLIDGYAAKAMANLERVRTLGSAQMKIQDNSYDRNARLWSFSVANADRQVPFAGLALGIDFTTIGDEQTIREEIIGFDEAVRGGTLKPSATWRFVRDQEDRRRFLLVVDFLSITNPLTGGTYALNLLEPILIRSYYVKGDAGETLEVAESTPDRTVGIDNLSYRDGMDTLHALSSIEEMVFLQWGGEKGVSKAAATPAAKPAAAATPAAKPAAAVAVKPVSFPVAKEDLVFRISNGAEPESLDPALIQGVPEHRIYMALFEGLVATDPQTALAVPGVAESWTISDDMTRYTFKLRKDALWSDGKAITADDVVYSWLRTLDPATAGPYAWFPCMFLAGAQEFNDGVAGPESVGIRALDDHTFQMDLIGPLPYALDALAHYSFAIVPRHAIEKYGSAWTDPAVFVGNGPFNLSERVAQSSITAVKNDKYWDKDNVALGKVIFYSSDSDATNYTMYLNGEVDWATNVPPDQVAGAQMRDDFQIAPQLATYYYVFQTQKAPVNNVLVRKALSLAVDRTALVEDVLRFVQIPAWGIVPPMEGYEALGFPYDDHDDAVDEARTLLAEAGYPAGRGFPTISILYNTNEGHKQIGQFIQRQWRSNLGIQAKLMNQEWQTYLSNRNQGNFTVARAGWVGDYPDPNTFLDMFLTGGGMNGGQYSNEVYDLLVNESARMEAGSDRMSVLKTAEIIMIDQDQALMPLYHYVTVNMVDTDTWGGWHTNVMDCHPPKAIYRKWCLEK